MLITNKSSLRMAKRTLKRVRTLPVFFGSIVVIFSLSFLFQGFYVRETVHMFLYDASALFLSIMERPFTDLEGYKRNFQYQLSLQENARGFDTAVTHLKGARHKTHRLEIQNKELRDLLSLQGASDKPFVTAPCFGQNALLNSQALFVHAGQNSGIQRFDLVLSEDAIVGQVDQVGGETSRVLLITDSKSHVPVQCKSSSQEGILYGSDSGGMTLEFIRNSQDLIMGDIVFSSGIDGYFPRGIPIGTITEITKNKIMVMPLVDFNSLRYVQIQKAHTRQLEAH